MALHSSCSSMGTQTARPAVCHTAQQHFARLKDSTGEKKKRQQVGERCEKRSGQCKKKKKCEKSSTEAGRNRSEAAKKEHQRQNKREEWGRRVGGGGGEDTLKETNQCWYLGVRPHIQQCGNQLSPGGWTSRRAEESTPLYPCGSAVTVGARPSPSSAGVSSGTKSESVCRDSVTVHTSQERNEAGWLRGGHVCTAVQWERAAAQVMKADYVCFGHTQYPENKKNNIFQVKYPMRDLCF